MCTPVCPAELVTAITAAAIALAQGRSAEDTAWLGVVLVHLGETLTPLSFQQSRLEQQSAAPSLDAEIAAGSL